jgi:hypothetical protein
VNTPRGFTEIQRVWIALLGVALALAWSLVPPRWRRPALVGILALSAVNYVRWGPEMLVSRIDTYDLIHYYVNAKYMEELGYLDLYPAILLADAENGGPFFAGAGNQFMAQDAAGHHFAPIAEGVERGRVVRAERFTPERWEAFEHDALYLQRTRGCYDRTSKGKCIREMSDSIWNELINDHGFNGTTVWTLLAEPIANAVPVEYVKVLCYLDIALLAAAFGVVGWAYGLDAALFGLVFLLVTYSTRWPTLSWAFLRYDWLAALVAATALLRRSDKPWTYPVAGVLAGWAATLRMFPAMYLWGPFARGLWGLVEREVRKPLLALALGTVLSAGLLQGLATARYGADTVREHFENMENHNTAEQLSSRRIGLALALATEPWKGTDTNKLISKAQKATVDRQKPLRYALAAAGTLALGFALRRRRDDEAFAWGFLPFFLFTTASYYYYVARVPLAVVHAGRLDRWRHRVGLAMLLATESWCSFCEVWFTGHRMLLIGTLAWAICVYAVVQIVWMQFDAPETDQPA